MRVKFAVRAESLMFIRLLAMAISGALALCGQDALSITTPDPLPGGIVGQSYSLVLAATGGTPAYRWAVGPGLPPGLTLNASSGTIGGTPTTAGSFGFSVQVVDASQRAATTKFNLAIGLPPLSITTIPPLFVGSVGAPYAQTFSASGGVPPYSWSMISGTVTGLTLDAASGTLQGTPQAVGSLSIVIQVTDRNGTRVSQPFSLIIAAPTLSITTGSPLPDALVGAPYSQKFSVVGGTAPYTWTWTSALVPGLSFDPGAAVLSGTPTTPGTFAITMQVLDSAGLTATRSFALTIAAAALKITTATQLTDAALSKPFSQTIKAFGGVPPYTWSANGLPGGLSIDAASGSITGTPSAAGSFTLTIRVTDSALTSSVDLFRINVILPPTPSATVSGLPDTVQPAQQLRLQISLDSPFAAPITGQAILSFAPDVGGGDATIQFSSGGRTADFSVPAGATDAISDVPLAIQTGTAAGTIGVSLRLQAGSIDITPNPAPTVTARIERAAPVINAARVTRNGNAISIEIAGYSTAREVTQATFTFNAASGQTLQASDITVPLESLFATWFQDSSSTQYGSQFVFVQQFTIQGDASAVIPVSVTMANRLGTATANITQ